ncbi:MAG: helix-turn-helix domain-containing protein [Bdellovibrionales bacterium]|nr:helix-turn-helix domain-containing protein [Bdellovibrionales bacterium]
MAKKDIGTILKNARLKKRMSQMDLASMLRLNSPQSISDWERNYGSGIPLPTLKRLIKFYHLDVSEVFDALLDFQQMKLEEKLKAEFFGKKAAGK